MTDRLTAEAQLGRILRLLPFAGRADGATLEELASIVGGSADEVLRDLTEVYTRAYYLSSGAAEDVQVLIDADRAEVWTKSDFRRPARLTAREEIALGLGLRVLASEADEPQRTAYLDFAGRLEGRLLAAGSAEEGDYIALEPSEGAAHRIRTLLSEAARDRRGCRIEYLRPGEPRPEKREVDPYALLVASANTYLIGYCHARAGIRTFRLDRIIEASTAERTFEIPDEFDPGEYISEGRVYRPDQGEEVVVRYSPRIVRWIQEGNPVELLPDGRGLVRHNVADPGWIIRHVLEHGPDAEVISPASYRDKVREVAAALAAGG